MGFTPIPKLVLNLDWINHKKWNDGWENNSVFIILLHVVSDLDVNEFGLREPNIYNGRMIFRDYTCHLIL